MEKATHGSPGVWKATLSNSVSVLAIGECLFPFSHELLKVYFQPWNTATCLWPWCSLLTFPKERAATVVILLGSRRLTSVAGSQLRWAGTVLPKQSPVYVAPTECLRQNIGLVAHSAKSPAAVLMQLAWLLLVLLLLTRPVLWSLQSEGRLQTDLTYVSKAQEKVVIPMIFQWLIKASKTAGCVWLCFVS